MFPGGFEGGSAMTTSRRPLRIAHITGEGAFSGGEVQVFLLLEGLRKRGHENVLLCPPDSASADEARRRGIEQRPIRARNEWSPRNAWGIRRQLLASRPDVVHLHTGRANWLGGLASWQLGLPAITTRRMDRPVKRNLRTRFVYGSVARRAVAISAAVQERLIAGGVPGAMIRVIRSAVDPGALVPQVGRLGTRLAEGLDDATPCLLTVAALIHRKGVDVLLAALGRLASEGLFPVLWIAGEGPQRASLERDVRYHQLEGQVRFLGHRTDVPDLLAACDCFVLPSRQEGLGVAALEAMALGRPAIVTRVGGLAETVVDGQTGLVVPPEDPVALKDALVRLLRDAELRERLGAGGLRRIDEGFRADQLVNAYERVYFEVLEEAGRS